MLGAPNTTTPNFMFSEFCLLRYDVISVAQ